MLLDGNGLVTHHQNKFDPQSLPMIVVGRCPDSNGVQFYNLSSGTFVSSIDYTCQPNVTSGTKFGYTYQPGIFIYRLDETTTIYAPKFLLDSEVLVYTHSPPHHAKVIGLPLYDRPDIYTVLLPDGSIAEYSDTSAILKAAPVSSIKSPVTLLPNWIQGGTNATLFLDNMTKPCHGKLQLSDSNIWVFCPETNTALDQGISLPDLPDNCQRLLDTGQLFRGHATFRRVYNARAQVQLHQSVLRHVSAHGLLSLVAPTSLKAHSTMNPTDRYLGFSLL